MFAIGKRGFALAAVIVTAGYLIVRSPGAPPWTSVSSPSGGFVATKAYGPADTADRYTLAIMARSGLLPRTRPLLFGDNPTGVVGDDGATFAWTDERNLVIGWPVGATVTRGPAKLDDVAINYIVYQPDLDELSSSERRQGFLHDVAYGFEEVDEPKLRTKQCVIHIIGTDGVFFDRLLVDVIGYGIGSPSDQYISFGTVRVRFSLVKQQSGNIPLMTFTQAKVAAVFPIAMRTASPRQNELQLYYLGYTYDEAVRLLSTLLRGNFDVKIGLNFGRVVVSYHAAAPIDRGLITKFLECAATTNIYGIKLPRSLD